MIEQPRYGWASPVIVTALITAVIAVTAFLLVEWRSRHPLVKLELFTKRNSAVGKIETLSV